MLPFDPETDLVVTSRDPYILPFAPREEPGGLSCLWTPRRTLYYSVTPLCLNFCTPRSLSGVVLTLALWVNYVYHLSYLFACRETCINHARQLADGR